MVFRHHKFRKEDKNRTKFETWGLILAAAGSGSRMGGGLPKQFMPIEEFPLYLYSLHPFITFVKKTVIVVPNSQVREVEEDLGKTYADPVLADFLVVGGGESRQESVRIGLKNLPPSIEKVLIHDAARPLITAELIERVIQGTEEQG